MGDIKSTNDVSQQNQVVSTSATNTGNINKIKAESTSSWAMTIGRYLLQRRVQTQTAYQGQLLLAEAKGVADNQEWLFEAIFEMLVLRLEEGHTVWVIDDATDDGSDILFADNTTLLAWQKRLLGPLIQPLFTVLARANMTDISASAFLDTFLNTLLESDGTWDAAMRQSVLPVYEQQILNQRRQICIKLYQSLKQIAEDANSIGNSLSNFEKEIQKHPLFVKFTEDEKNVTNPIVYQINKNRETDTLNITLWLQRTWQAEYALAKHVLRIKNQEITALPISTNPLLNKEQQDAINMANQSAFSIITGGPGTGKTFTVAQLVMALQQAQPEDSLVANSRANLALAAPTGKAAQRMQESLQDAIQLAGVDIQLPEAKTIHRLLGIGQGGRPRYHKDNPLSEDIIIVDEASMLGVELANHLVSAVKADARLILLGDANQLAAVDAGAVLADLCRLPVLQDVHQCLVESRRFDEKSGIGKLARLINQAEQERHSTERMQAVWQLFQQDEALKFYHLLDSETSNDTELEKTKDNIRNSLSNYKFYQKISENYLNYFELTKRYLNKVKRPNLIPIEKRVDDFNALIESLNQFRVLTAGHHGYCGDHQINRYLSDKHKSHLKIKLSKSTWSWYHGRPVM
ncbi:ATP-dependent DNA helicase, partial [Psychrobacter sp.]|uniref:ATP-dependent DNA helicase n=1 Tax=Psychrobacter sp. TaxID=56811 RepID=UPI003F9DF316